MAQPTGSATLSSTWIAKGLKGGFYISADGNGAFVFDNTSTSSAAVPTSTFVATPANTTVGSDGNRRLNINANGTTVLGAMHDVASPAFNAAIGNNMTFVFDLHPQPGVSGQNQGKIFYTGDSNAGALGVSIDDTSSTSTTVICDVRGPSYGTFRSASMLISGSNQTRLAFKYVQGSPIEVYLGGVLQTPTSAVNDYSGTTPEPNMPRRFIDGTVQYSIIPKCSHFWMFDTALSSTDIAALSSDAWAVIDSGSTTHDVTIANSNQANVASTGSIALDATTYVAGSNSTQPNVCSTGAIYSGAGGTLTTPPLKNNTGTLLANETGATVFVHSVSTGALVVSKTGQATNASGVMTINDALIVAATQYRVVVVLGSGAEGMDKLTAS